MEHEPVSGQFRLTARTTRGDVREIMALHGFQALLPRAAEVLKAHRAGRLSWTKDRLVTADESRIDAVPLTDEDVE